MDLQAMDKHHRIGQTKPVHVYRQTTAHSIEGRMLKRAFASSCHQNNHVTPNGISFQRGTVKKHDNF